MRLGPWPGKRFAVKDSPMLGFPFQKMALAIAIGTHKIYLPVVV
jgi:hypothetical protein